MILYVLLLCSFAVATTEFVLVGLLPEIAAELSVPIATAGLLVTAYMVVVTIGAPAAVILTRRLSRTGVLAAAMALALGSAIGSALSGTFALLLAARMGSALAQALFVAVASQVAMAAVPPERQTAAIAKVFNGFALATVIGLPIGTLIGQAAGWHAAFWLVAILSGAGLVGVLAYGPRASTVDTAPLRTSLAAIVRPATLLGLSATLLAFTGFVTAFTYVAPALRQITGLSGGWVSIALLVYGTGTIAGNTIAGRVRPTSILRVLPVPLGVLTLILAVQGGLMRTGFGAMVAVFVLGAAAFTVAPLLQTWLMGEAGPDAAGLAAALNISVFGLAGALGAALGGAVLSGGLGLGRLGPIAAIPLAGALGLALVLRRWRSRRDREPVAVV
jgi:MFS transporter, DHA1 family, inner membrane transport protein